MKNLVKRTQCDIAIAGSVEAARQTEADAVLNAIGKPPTSWGRDTVGADRVDVTWLGTGVG